MIILVFVSFLICGFIYLSIADQGGFQEVRGVVTGIKEPEYNDESPQPIVSYTFRGRSFEHPLNEEVEQQVGEQVTLFVDREHPEIAYFEEPGNARFMTFLLYTITAIFIGVVGWKAFQAWKNR